MELSSILQKYCGAADHHKTGLFLLDLPTGFGKTYEVVNFIYQHYQSLGRKIVFITDQKKNLPLEALKKRFEEDGRLPEFEHDVIQIDANVDCVIENLLIHEEQIPEEIKSDKSFKKLSENIAHFKELSVQTDATSIAADLAEKIKEDIRNKHEPRFRQFVSKYIQKRTGNKKKAIELVKKSPDYQWIAKVYPAALSAQKRVFFMSIHKFLVKNTPVVSPAHEFMDKSFLKNALIFIDEFDASKNVILEQIIKSRLKKRIDVTGLFEQIYSSFTALTLPRELAVNSKALEQKKQQNHKLQDIKTIIEKLKQEAGYVHKKYNISFSLKTEGAENSRNFLFHDQRYHTIVKDDKSFIYLQQDTEEAVTRIHFVNRDAARRDRPSVTEFLSVINTYLNFFKTGARLIAENYQQRQNENGKENFTFENALNTFLDELKIAGKDREYLVDSIQAGGAAGSRIQEGLEDRNDMSIYNKGFQYYDFEDSELHDTKSRIFINDFNTSPEKILLYLASNNLVAGISATASIDTVTGNYDLEYLKEKLGSNFYSLEPAENNALKEAFEKKHKNYVPVKVKFLEVDDWKKELRRFGFEAPVRQRLITSIEQQAGGGDSDSYIIRRYLKIARVYEEFIKNEDIRSFLCFLNTHPSRSNPSCKLQLLEELFKAVLQKHGQESTVAGETCTVLTSTGFEAQKEKLHRRLAGGGKLFVITTYRTLGAGQNIQYSLKNFDELLAEGKIKQVHRPENYIPVNEKDFDGIYLDKPTNLLVNVNNEELEEFDVNKRIFQVEMLHQARQIFYSQVIWEVKNTFSKAFYKHAGAKPVRPKNVKQLYHLEDYRNFATREIIQAIGRINRTCFKGKEVHVLADREIAPLVANFDVAANLCLKEFAALVAKAGIWKPAQSELGRSNQIGIEHMNMYGHSWINSKVKSSHWRETAIADWETLRELVLRHPVLPKTAYQTREMLPWRFVWLPMLDADFVHPQPRDSYWYTEENDYTTVHLNFAGEGQAVSGQAVNLPGLMQNPALKAHFEEKGYATSFATGDYVLSPIMFNNIYKGALGEATGKFVFEKYIMPGTRLQPLPEDIFERFDFMLDDGVYIDFKFWDDGNRQDPQAQLDRIFNHKVAEIQKKGYPFSKLLVVNILASGHFPVLTGQNGQLLEVPCLLNKQDFTLNTDNIIAIREFINH